MHRYLLFTGKEYYPLSMCGDFLKGFDSYEEAVAAIPPLDLYEWACIWDAELEENVKEEYGGDEKNR